MKALRIVHSVAAWGAAFFKCLWRKQERQELPQRAYGAIPHTIRDEAVSPQYIVAGRAKAARRGLKREFYNVANAFCSPSFEAHTAALSARCVATEDAEVTDLLCQVFNST